MSRERSLAELAAYVGGQVVGDSQVKVSRMAAIDVAGEGDVAFVNNRKYIPYLKRTGASAILVTPEMVSGDRNFIVCDNPYLAFARITALLTEEPPEIGMGIDPRADVSPEAELGREVRIGPFVTVKPGARIGDRVTLMSGVHVGWNVMIGEDSTLFSNVVVYYDCRIGKRVILHANVVVGSDGFGFAPDGERYEKIPQRRPAVIEDDVSIGANTTVNRGALRDTVIGEGSKIDSNCVISHGVQIGANALVVSQVGISGSVTIGRNVTLAGQVGVAGHLAIGDHVRVGAQSGVTHDLASGKEYLGTPARKVRKARRVVATASRLPELREHLRDLRRRVADIEEQIKKEV